jgi:hypothetical protein
VLESKLQLPVGGRTLIADAKAPLDFLAGMQGRFGRARVTLGVRYHAHSLPSGELRRSPLAGFVDLTDASDADARGYLAAIGLGGASDQLRSNVQRAVAPTRSGRAAACGRARVIPETYAIRSEHQLGYVLLLGWRFCRYESRWARLPTEQRNPRSRALDSACRPSRPSRC